MSYTYEDLQKYVGKEYNNEVKNQIETQFYPYIVETCDMDQFYCEDFWLNQIRCGLLNGIINAIQFN